MNLPMKVPEEFEQFYSQHWGERWPALLNSLLKPTSYVAWLNPFVQFDFEQKFPDAEKVLGIENLYSNERGFFPPPEPEQQSGLLPYYLLDGASALAIQLLEFHFKSQKILDMCAAPGGKALQIAAKLDRDSQLILADISTPRINRLKSNLKSYLPKRVLNQIEVMRRDGVQWGIRVPDSFDLVLLDAPCSSERHLLQQPKYLEQWSPKRTKSLSKKQFALLSSGFLALKPGGTLIYLTCSISPRENDWVIEKLIKRRSEQLELLSPELPLAEKTEFGFYYLPDSSNWGPLYLSIIRKTK